MNQERSKFRQALRKLAFKLGLFWAYRKDDHKLKFTLKYLPRGLFSPFRKLPDFLIVGAGKAGTTSLYQYLLQHDQVLPALRKEVNYWNQYNRYGINWYKGNFPLKITSRGKVTGEATQNYLRYPKIAYSIKKDVPDVKIIIILRNPVDRTFSDFNYQVVKNKRESLDFETALTFEEYRPLNMRYRIQSMYYDLIKPYFEVFSQDQILILDFELLSKEPLKLMNIVCDFLKISRKTQWSFEKYNPSDYKNKIKPKTRKWLNEFFIPHNEKLFGFIGKKFNWK